MQERVPCFTATGLELSSRQRWVLEGRLGAKVVEDWTPEVTHLVADTFRRTTKLMCAICAGTHVVMPAYIEACREEGRLVDEEPFLLRDAVCEAAFAKKHGLAEYSLPVSLARARAGPPVLRGISVFCGAAVAGRRELQTLVEAAGGRWLRRPSAAGRRDSSASTGSAARPSCVLVGGVAYDAELLREAACTQVLRYDHYRL